MSITNEKYIYLFKHPLQERNTYRFEMRYGFGGKKKARGKWRRTIREAIKDRDNFIKTLTEN